MAFNVARCYVSCCFTAEKLTAQTPFHTSCGNTISHCAPSCSSPPIPKHFPMLLQWMGILSSGISKHLKINPFPSLRSHLTSSPMGILLGNYGTYILRVLMSNFQQLRLRCTHVVIHLCLPTVLSIWIQLLGKYHV